ncbi:hypothetical protein WIS52_05015 [Pseudonocardia nematodicida]|uniref:Uncharacterized protein n=1 Tax=Pseudonocardia nematodicida TaxID=1206997 RepID=A0ABV1K5S4_9PSEU
MAEKRLRRAVPAGEVDRLLDELPPVDARAWSRDRAEVEALLDDGALGDPAEDGPR